jgi:LacI family transcriptional regulator
VKSRPDDRLKSRRSTIKDVAAEAQVSISTVSLVMNEKGNVRTDTRDRVLSSARRLGYVPTQAARHLASKRTGNVGFVVREDHFTRSEPFYTRVFLGTEFQARHDNLYVLLTTIPSLYVPGKNTPRLLREYNVDGLIVAGRVDESFLEEARDMEIPLVLVDFEANGCPAIIIDNQDGAREAVDHLLDRGRRRIAFLGADTSHPSISARLDGYRLAHAARGLTAGAELLVCADGDPTRGTGMRLSERLFEMRPKPDAVFCANDALALSVLEGAVHAGVKVPEDLAVIGFDDVPDAAHSRPPLTTVRVYKEQLGELAMRYIVDLVEEGSMKDAHFERGGHTTKVKTELIVRDST